MTAKIVILYLDQSKEGRWAGVEHISSICVCVCFCISVQGSSLLAMHVACHANHFFYCNMHNIFLTYIPTPLCTHTHTHTHTHTYNIHTVSSSETVKDVGVSLHVSSFACETATDRRSSYIASHSQSLKMQLQSNSVASKVAMTGWLPSVRRPS